MISSTTNRGIAFQRTSLALKIAYLVNISMSLSRGIYPNNLSCAWDIYRLNSLVKAPNIFAGKFFAEGTDDARNFRFGFNILVL
jgi:hypothetical protein